MPMTPPRPDSRTLEEYLLGRLTPERADRVKDWLEGDPEADEVLTGIEAADSITRTLAEPAPAISCSESVVDATIESLAHDVAPSSRGDSDSIIPSSIGKYRIVGIIGLGGMGIVLEAVHESLDLRVAIKLIADPNPANRAIRARFQREAEAVAKIGHDNVVPIYDFGEDDGRPFIVMKLLKGETLEARLKRTGSLSAAEVRRIGRDIAAGLTAAHAVGVIHRDIKPSNIWIDADTGRALILDFGLAKPLEEANTETALTRVGGTPGTPQFMAPEQAEGDVLDVRADLFSLGAVLYQAATGNRPFSGLREVLTITPPAPKTVNPSLPARLSAIIQMLLEKNPADRPASASAVMEALAEPFAPAPPWRLVFPWWAIAASVLLVLVIAAATYQIVFTTKDGTLLVEVNEEADLRFKNGELHIYGEDGKLKYRLKPGDRSAKLPPGEYRVKVIGADGVELETPEFKMTKTGTVSVRVKAKPNEVVKKNGTSLDPDRTAAEWVLSIGGKVRVNRELRDRLIGELPNEPFRLTAVFFDANKRVTDAGLAILKDCKDIEALNIGKCFQVTDAGLSHFRNWTKLESLYLERVNITDAGLAHFKGCIRLKSLDVHVIPSKIGNEGLAHLKDCTELEQVGASWSPRVTDAALDTIRNWKKLIFLNLTHTAVTDAELALLKDHTSLRMLQIGGTRITSKGLVQLEGLAHLRYLSLEDTTIKLPDVKAFAEKMPYCRINHNGGEIVPNLWLDRWFAEYALSVGGRIRVNDEERERPTIADLPKEPFRLTWVKIGGSPRATDEHLTYIGCENLKYLDLSGTQFSAVGRIKQFKSLVYLDVSKSNFTATQVEEIRRALPWCRIAWDGGTIEPMKK